MSGWDLGVSQYLRNPPPATSDPNTVQNAIYPERTYANQQSYGLSQALNAGQIQAAPQFAQNQSFRDQIANQLSLTNASQQQESGYLNQDYQTGLAQNDLQQSSLGIQRGALSRQSPLSGTLHDLALQGIGLGERGANQQADIARRGALSSAVTRGAVSSPGLRQDYSDIANQLANQVQGYGIQRGQENVTFAEKQAQLKDQNATLDLQAKSLNLSRDQLKTELDRGIDRLGLSTALTTADLLGKMNSSNIDDQVLAQQIFNAAIQNSDYYAQFSPQQQSPPAMSGGGSSRSSR